METPTPTAPAGTAPVASITPAAPAVAPAAVPAPTPAPAVATSSPDLKKVLGKMSSAERLLFATGRAGELVKSAPTPAAPAIEVPPAAVAAVPEPVPAPAAEAAPVAETPPAVAETPAAPAAAEGDDIQPNAEEGNSAGRVRLKGDDFAIAVLAKTKNISILEAAKIFAGNAPAPVAAPAPVVPAAPAVDPAIEAYDAQIAEAEAQIATLTTERDAATDDLDHKGANKLNDRIADLKADLRMAKNEKQGHLRNVQQQTQAGYDATRDAAVARVYTDFPQFAEADSQERLALDAYVNRAIKDPNRKALFKDPTWPDTLGREFAAKYGHKSKAAAGTAPAAPAPVVVKPAITRQPPAQVLPASGPRLLTGGDGHSTPSSTRPPTKERALELVRNDPEARRAIMREAHKLRAQK